MALLKGKKPHSSGGAAQGWSAPEGSPRLTESSQYYNVLDTLSYQHPEFLHDNMQGKVPRT
jgi:hypothetical protein